MELKKILKTKTFWSGLGLIVYGAINQDIESVITGLSVIFLRDAMLKKEDDRNFL